MEDFALTFFQASCARTAMGGDMTSHDNDQWTFWIDRGGTFTDIIGLDPNGHFRTAKLLSDDPEHYDDAAIEGMRRLLGLAKDTPIPSARIAMVRMGTTVVTNALLQRKGAKTLFVTTRGFADALVIGDQTRDDIFALELPSAQPLYAQVLEVDARLGADGKEVRPLNEAAALRGLQDAYAQGCRAAAICLLHGYAHPAHEQRLAALARQAGFAAISTSALDPLQKLVPRASSVVADAALSPVLDTYLQRLRARLKHAPLYFMKSSGGLAPAEVFRARDAVLSGPAGGVTGMARTALAAGFDKVIGFDMGGTSTDVSRAEGGVVERMEGITLKGVHVRAPMVAVHTVAAGGGSILHYGNLRAQVGPMSAGAMPGPACYGHGGPATLTDANLVLGRLDAQGFPKVFGKTGTAAPDSAAAQAALAALAQQMGAPDAKVAALGFMEIAIENIAQAVKAISSARGIDPAAYALASFGGAGGQMACALAGALGMKTVLVHPFAGLLSAFGIGLAQVRAERRRAVLAPLNETGLRQARKVAGALRLEAEDELRGQHIDPQGTQCVQELWLRYAGSDSSLVVPLDDLAAMQERFARDHRRLYGFARPGALIEIEALALTLQAPPPRLPAMVRKPATAAPEPLRVNTLTTPQGAVDLPVYALEDFGAGAEVHGPALLLEPHSQVLVEPGWHAAMGADGLLKLTASAAHQKTKPTTNSRKADPVQLELFNRRFMGVAVQMGRVLERTALSVNMKERLDFSCAVFDETGALVANAPHMPVHLGSMSASVREVIRRLPGLRTGDAVALNSPFAGGTHVPDITVVMPVAAADDGAIQFYVAARGHHADIGGVQPGSMPPFSTSIEEEGVIFDCLPVLRQGRFDEKAVRKVLASSAWPARNPQRNIADLQAQIAACTCGAAALRNMVSAHGRDQVQAYMGHVRANAEAAVRTVIGRLHPGAAIMPMDCGACIKVRIDVDQAQRSARIDFTGTSAQMKNNFNAPAAVARAAVLYVFRCLADADIPLNEGCLAPLEIIIPKGTLLNPEPPAAVVAGNVETSQHVVDALFAATGTLAAAQGTMNNFTFGDARNQYYETICGGAGAGPGFAGRSAIHTHMTNSRLTDPEVLESRFAVRVEYHRVRHGSGGAGRWRGGEGSVRCVRFLAPMEAALLSSRRRNAPPGLAGGGDGAPGTQKLIRADGVVQELEGCFKLRVHPGDCIEISTPGGGGFAAAKTSDKVRP